MSKQFKIKFWIGCICVILFVFLFIFLHLQGLFVPHLSLVGKDTIQVEINDTYQEQGAKAKRKFVDMSHRVEIKSNVNTSILGEYRVTYSIQNQQKQRRIQVVDTQAPFIQLIGENTQIVFQNEEYVEQGVSVIDNSKEELNENVIISHHIQTQLLGDYEIVYRVVDSSGNEATKKRSVKVVENPVNETLFYHYDAIDNTRKSWWFHKASDHQRQSPSFSLELMNRYGAYFLGNDEKVIYLTFDEGGNTITYIKEITQILNQHNIQSTYFLTRNYIEKEAQFMRQLVSEGHVIGNHTRRHPDMTTLANEQGLSSFLSEINDTQKTIYEVTQTIPHKIFRFPSGDYSERALAMVHDMGYTTYFWSHAYNDYSGDVSKEVSYQNLVQHLHPGAIYLLHPSNKGNFEAMEDFIVEAQKQGYRFDLVTNMS